MLEKHLYDSWKSIMELYMMNRPHETIQADCDIKAINIILQGLPTEIYALVSQHRVAKDIWEKIKLLMQGTSLTIQERECNLYDEFDKFTYKKGESLHEYYLRFTLLLNDMNIYNMPLEQFQVNTKFLNTLPAEWSKFVTDVKLVKDLHITNVDQIHAHLEQRERHANEVRLLHERNSDPLALVASHQMTHNQLRNSSNPRQQATINEGRVTVQPVQGRKISYAADTTRTFTPGASRSNSGKQRIVTYYNCKGEGHMSKQCTKLRRKQDDSWFNDKVLLVQAQASGQILHEEELVFLADPGIPEDAFAEVRNHDNMNNNIINQAVQVMSSSEQSNVPTIQNSNSSALILSVIEQLKTQVANCTKINLENKSVNDTLTAELERYKEQVKVLKEGQNVDLRSNDNVSDSSAQSVEIDHLKQTLSEHLKEKESLMQIVSFLKDDFKKEESRNIDREIALEKRIKQLDNIVFKRDQSAQIVHMLTKPQFFYDHTTKQALETLMLAEESHLKMLLKQKDPIMLEKKVNTTPVDYANSVNFVEPTLSSRPTNVEVPKELLKISMVNTSLNKLKHHLAGFDVVVKERTTPTAITEESKTFEVKLNQVLNKNERLLEQVINKDIVNVIMNSFEDIASVNVHECEKCLKLETELQTDFIEKEIYDKLFKSFTTLEKHCISLEVDSQLNQEIFQRDNSVSNQSAPSFDQLFELNELKAQSQEKDTIIKKLKERIKSLSGKLNENKIKKDLEEIETINIELDHRVSKLIAENEHLKQTYKQLYDSIKPTPLKDDLRKLKGKALVDNDVTKHPTDPEMLKIDVEPITPKLLNKQTAHSAYIKHTQEEATVLRDLVEHVKSKYPLDQSLESACRYAKLLQELLTHISKTCPSINNTNGKIVAVTPKNKDKRVRFTEPVTSSGNTITKTTSTSNLVSNKPMLSSTGVKPSTSASGSQPSGNTKKDRIRQTPSSTQKNKVEAHPRKVKSSLKNKDCVVQPKGTAHVQHSKLNANSELKCVKCNGCMLSDNHDLCVLDFINNVNARKKSKSVNKSSKRKVWKPTGKVFSNIGYIWRPTSRTFTIVGNACPLTRITTTTEVPSKKPIALENETPKPVVTLVYSRKPRKSKTNVPISKSKVLKSVSANKKEPIKFGNDHIAKILGYGDYQIGNVTILRVYYVEGLGHNLFSVGQFYDSNLEVAFCQHTCFIRNLEGVDLLTGSRGNNLYTLSLGDMMASSPICLWSNALVCA
ncbi:hypothetical protein Tco_0949963 [Tanacetum coccineum]